jgi:hypothetical protein
MYELNWSEKLSKIGADFSNPAYFAFMQNIAKFIKDNLSTESILEIGFGNGVLFWANYLNILHDSKTLAGIETDLKCFQHLENKFFNNGIYFEKLNRFENTKYAFKDKCQLLLEYLDIYSNGKIPLPKCPKLVSNYYKFYDTVIAIEVFEHIENNMIHTYLKNLRSDFFVFSSTPKKSKTDIIDGHINIKTEFNWINIFGLYGYALNTELTYLFQEHITHGLIFQSII